MKATDNLQWENQKENHQVATYNMHLMDRQKEYNKKV